MILSWSLLISIGLAIIVLAFLVIKKDSRNKVNQYFFILAMAIVLWMIFVFFENGVRNIETASVFLRFDFAMGPIMACAFLIFSFYFPDRIKALSKSVPWCLWLLSLMFSGLSFTDLIVRNIIINNKAIRFEQGYLYLFYALYLLGFIAWASLHLIRKLRRSSGLKKLQILYILLGLGITGSLVSIFNLFFANFLPLEISRIAIYAFIIFIYCTAYAIIRYRLLDIRIVIQKGIIYSLLLIIISVVYSIIVVIANLIMGEAGTWSAIISAGISVIILSFTLPMLENIFKKWTDRIFFKAPIDYREALHEINLIFSTEINLTHLVNRTIKFIKDDLKIESAVFISRQADGKGADFIFENNKRAKLPLNHWVDSLLDYYRKNKKADKFLISDDLNNNRSKDLNLTDKIEVIKTMNSHKIALCFPVFSKTGFVGLFCLGRKKEETPYFQQDLDWFDIIARQFGLALERAMIYENLENLVGERTVQLRAANGKLKEISEAKSEFVSVASHQLKTPLTVVKDIFSLFVSGDLGKVTAKQLDFSQRGIKQIEKLIDLVNMLLNISRIETGRMNLEVRRNNLNQLIAEKIKDFDPLIKTANLTINFQPSLQLKAFNFDKNLIREVIGNLLDNAIKYTPKGSMNIQTKLHDDKAMFSITDTGLGISSESMPKLFHRFIRGEDNRKIYIAGTGLGLYFCLRVIGAHNGRIWAESPGINQGATFKFELPLKA